MSVRATAIARQDQEIYQSEQRAIAARDAKPRSALEAMAVRLSVSPKALQSTLMNTAFKGCSEAEFVALVIVSNVYDLNPLLREIYAFPKKGGGIQAIVGYDGWIKIADRHPEFDGYEAVHIRAENGAIEAMEGLCYRKDRNHPTKKMVYLKEFKRNTDPWNNSPNHMLDVRCFCQTIRLGLGVSGLGVEGIDDVDGGELRPVQATSVPSRQALAEELDDEIPAFENQSSDQVDPNTGEVTNTDSRGMTEVDEEAARALDAGEQDTDKPDSPEADHYGAKPASAKHGESWWDEGAEKLRWAVETQNGMKWYLQKPAPLEEAKPKPQDDQPTQDQAAAKTVADIDGPLEQQEDPAEQQQDETPAWHAAVDKVRQMAADARDRKGLSAADAEFVKISAGLPDEVQAELEGLLNAARRKLAEG